jgi:hypothetical protein
MPLSCGTPPFAATNGPRRRTLRCPSREFIRHRLTPQERASVVAVIECWIREQDATAPADEGGAGKRPAREDPQIGLDLG